MIYAPVFAAGCQGHGVYRVCSCNTHVVVRRSTRFLLSSHCTRRAAPPEACWQAYPLANSISTFTLSLLNQSKLDRRQSITSSANHQFGQTPEWPQAWTRRSVDRWQLVQNSGSHVPSSGLRAATDAPRSAILSNHACEALRLHSGLGPDCPRVFCSKTPCSMPASWREADNRARSSRR